MLDVARDPVFRCWQRSPRLALCGIPEGGPAGTRNARTAGFLDTWIRRLAGREARVRLALGRLASAFLSRRHHHDLGFARLSDYGHERVGISTPELRSLAKVADGLDGFPATRDAFLRGELSWTKVRLILPVLATASEREWIARAALLTTRDLEEEIRKTVEERPGDESTDQAATKAATTTLNEISEEDGKTIDGEPAVRFRKHCSRRVRRIWNRVTELARRTAGEQLCSWRTAECIAAEGLSGAPVERIEEAAVSRQSSAVTFREAERSALDVHKDTVARTNGTPTSEPAAAAAVHPVAGGYDSAPFDEHVCGIDLSGLQNVPDGEAADLDNDSRDLGPHDLDLHMRALVSALQRIDWTAGTLLRVAADLRVYRQLGFPSLAEYARDRLGISPRKVYALVSLDRKTSSLGEISSAYREGKLSWSRALAILPVIDREGANASAWVSRAQAMTIRRLRDEVEWAIDRAELASEGSPPVPPALDARLETPELHMRAPAEVEQPEDHDAEIAFTGPESVVSLFWTAVRAWTDSAETTERGLEKLLLHAYGEWTSQPRHRDPVFERDGWRCSVPDARPGGTSTTITSSGGPGAEGTSSGIAVPTASSTTCTGSTIRGSRCREERPTISRGRSAVAPTDRRSCDYGVSSIWLFDNRTVRGNACEDARGRDEFAPLAWRCHRDLDGFRPLGSGAPPGRDGAFSLQSATVSTKPERSEAKRSGSSQ